jgi:hypothetical protein
MIILKIGMTYFNFAKKNSLLETWIKQGTFKNNSIYFINLKNMYENNKMANDQPYKRKNCYLKFKGS